VLAGIAAQIGNANIPDTVKRGLYARLSEVTQAYRAIAEAEELRREVSESVIGEARDLLRSLVDAARAARVAVDKVFAAMSTTADRFLETVSPLSYLREWRQLHETGVRGLPWIALLGGMGLLAYAIHKSPTLRRRAT